MTMRTIKRFPFASSTALVSLSLSFSRPVIVAVTMTVCNVGRSSMRLTVPANENAMGTVKVTVTIMVTVTGGSRQARERAVLISDE